jgi:Collagen triple helix repeat (20 copies)
MFERIHQKLGTAGFIISIVALVAALSGGAYAATGANSGGKATASAKAKQAKQGKQGKQGKTGKTGPAGPQGPAGPAGPKGDPGAAGNNGTPGTNGKSVTVTEINSGDPGECEETGGALVAQEGAPGVEVCGGEEGPEGSPWTAGGTLPKGSTETGVWAFSKGEKPGVVPISFPIPLAKPVGVHVLELGEPSTEECPGTPQEPKAKEGFLCLYTNEMEAPEVTLAPGGVGSATVGEVFNVFSGKPSLEGGGAGTWAVTAG